MMSRLEELRQKMVDSSQTSTERLKVKLEKEFSARLVAREEELQKQLEVEKQKFENVKQMEVEEVREKVRNIPGTERLTFHQAAVDQKGLEVFVDDQEIEIGF